MKFPIRVKVLALTLALSIALILSAVFISYYLYTNRMEQNAIELTTSSASSTAEFLNDGYIDFIESYRSKIQTIYEENRIELEQVMDPLIAFDSFNEREQFYTELIKSIFPAQGVFGSSYEAIELKNNYNHVVQYLDLLKRAEELEGAFVFFYDKDHNNIVYLLDSASDNSLLYNFPCSLEKPDQNLLDHVLNTDTIQPYFDEQHCYAYAAITGQDGEVLAYVGFSLNNERAIQSRKWFTQATIITMVAATLLLSVFYLVFVDRLIIKNLKKLAGSTEEFTSGLEEGKELKVYSADIKTSDELGDLSDKFNLMQHRMIGYVNSLEEKTISESRMKAELDVAANIQSEALPNGPFICGDITVESFLKPAKEVGGDFYDYFMLDDHRLFFYIADVSGKGVPAAMFMMKAKELIKTKILSGKDLPTFAYEVNNDLCTSNTEGLFISAFFSVLDTRDYRLKYLRAGHEQPFLRRNGKAEKIAEESNFIIGAFDNTEYISENLQLESGDVLLLYTDGLNEGIDSNEEEFGYDRIHKIIAESDRNIPERLYGSLLEFTGDAEQFDDVTMVCVSIKGEMHIHLDNPQILDISAVLDRVTEYLSPYDSSRVSEVGVIIDEVLNNIISYAFADASAPSIDLHLKVNSDSRIELRFCDNGFAFDPLRDVEEPSSKYNTESSESGWGIQLFRTLSDDAVYTRVEEKNLLTIRKSLLPAES